MLSSQGTRCVYCGAPLEHVMIGSRSLACVFRPCGCEAAQERRRLDAIAEARRKDDEAAQRRRRRYELAGIEPAYMDATAPEGLVAKAVDGCGLYLWGNSGCGKTWAASGMARVLMGLGKHVAFVSTGDFMRRIRATFGGACTEEQILNDLMAKDAVFIDDLGAEHLSDWTAATVEAVFDKCEKKGIQLIVTSNYDLCDLGTHLANGSDRMQAMRIVSRIAGLCEKVDMSGPDRRKR